MRRRRVRPVVVVAAIYVVLLGALAVTAWHYFIKPMRQVGEAIGQEFAEQLAEGIKEFAAVQGLPFPEDRPPDLDIAPGGKGYLALASGHELHFHDRDAGLTRIAVDSWFVGARHRIAVGEYDGPPSRDLEPEVVRPSVVLGLLSMLVVRAEGAAEVRWEAERGEAEGPYRAREGELNLLVPSGKLTLWADDGPRHEIDVGAHETVWCTLGPGSLAIDRRR